LEPVAGTSTKTFEGKTWYLKKGMAMLATPGKSNHNLGLAIDISSASEPKRLNWLVANVKDFGFSWEVVPSEPWHIRLVTGDKPTPAVMAFTGGTAPVVNLNTTPPIHDHKALQEALKAKGFYKGEINGLKDAATDAAVKAFKVANKLPADSVVGPKVKEILGLS
jgi:hypothetical protein